METVHIIGIGKLRFGKYPDKTVRGMSEEAINLALHDAGLRRQDLQAAFFANSFWGMYTGQHCIRGQIVLRGMGIEKIPVANVENACAGGSTALHLAYTGIRAGMFDVALAVGAEKLTHQDKAMSFKALQSALDLENYAGHMAMLADVGRVNEHIIPAEWRGSGQRSNFMDVYATFTRWHMATFGTTQRQLAHIASKNHFHASLNPTAQYQNLMSEEEVLADAPVVYPLTRAMCAPLGDGASAAIVCSERFLKKIGSTRGVKILASVLGQGSDKELDGEDIGERLSKQAYHIAGIGPQDIGLAELHDATSFGELHQSEVMGFCPRGEGGIFAESGATRLGGKIPLNTSGGLESNGHPVAASGLSQIHEVVTQLRGEAGKRQVQGARIGLAENGGGNIAMEEAAMCIHILERQ